MTPKKRNTFRLVKTLHAKTWENKLELFSWECLSEDICQLIFRPHEVELDHPFFNLFPYEVMSDVDVLWPGVLNIVAAKSNSTFVVTIHRDFVELEAIVWKLWSHPKNLCTARWHGYIFSLCRGYGSTHLLLRCPAHKFITQKLSTTRRTSPCVLTSRMIGIRISSQLHCSFFRILKTHVSCS